MKDQKYSAVFRKYLAAFWFSFIGLVFGVYILFSAPFWIGLIITIACVFVIWISINNMAKEENRLTSLTVKGDEK